ncbi:flagellar export chaperone FliS [Paenibacillus caui]|uniref:flagellar export chaperone FliS n=1 Tax=Paenibacillus caui TaxID=2873927 RepID=UPI001EFF634E|nr:flagellar export chaperone FliS [Paenibacillus caui]
MTSPNLAGYQAYQKNKYQTASPHRLTLMLFNGAIQFALNAKEAIQQGDITSTNKNVQKTQDIIYELISSLNMRDGGEIARNLRQLYFYIIERLIEANIKKRSESLDEVIGMLGELKTAWEAIGKGGTLDQ